MDPVEKPCLTEKAKSVKQKNRILEKYLKYVRK